LGWLGRRMLLCIVVELRTLDPACSAVFTLIDLYAASTRYAASEPLA